jgi:hypothetical protein
VRKREKKGRVGGWSNSKTDSKFLEEGKKIKIKIKKKKEITSSGAVEFQS